MKVILHAIVYKGNILNGTLEIIYSTKVNIRMYTNWSSSQFYR